jgi:hypothetical protein
LFALRALQPSRLCENRFCFYKHFFTGSFDLEARATFRRRPPLSGNLAIDKEGTFCYKHHMIEASPALSGFLAGSKSVRPQEKWAAPCPPKDVKNED